MSSGQTPSQGVTEGKSAYNRHATLQAAGAALSFQLLEKAAASIDPGPPGQPIVIADYGSSQGKNSLVPMQTAIRSLRARVEPDRPILVFHCDQPTNDFNTLFETLGNDPAKYDAGDPNVFPCAIGKSFYGNVLPRQYVDIGWSAYAAVWLSQIPMTIPGHFFALSSTGAVRAAFDRQGRQDWEKFLSLRASELRQGGRLVVVLPALNDDGSYGPTSLMDQANAGLAEMVDAGEITSDERGRMALAVYPRRKHDLLAPFTPDGQYRGLVVEHCAISVLPHPAWSNFETHRDKEVLAADLALFFRSTFVPSLAIALANSRGHEGRRTFSDELENRLKQRLVRDPAPLMHSVATFVVAKRGLPKV
jgi:SAM dependent carboxyl methyltransferase